MDKSNSLYKDILRLAFPAGWSVPVLCRWQIPVMAVVAGRLLACCLLLLMAERARAQAPVLAWSMNLPAGAKVFAVDEQTNVYANAGGTVFKLSGAGVPQATNAICPQPGVARRDAAGDYYFSGIVRGTQDFGGIVLVGGIYTGSRGDIFLPVDDVYVAKYGSCGGLLWATNLGVSGFSYDNRPWDLQVDPSGQCYVAYGRYLEGYVARLSSIGGKDWVRTVPSPAGCDRVLLGQATATNCYYLRLTELMLGGSVDSLGNFTFYGGPPALLYWNEPFCYYSLPVTAAAGGVYVCGRDLAAGWALQLTLPGGVTVWQRPVDGVQALIGSDASGNLYLAATNGNLSQYTQDGIPVWTTNYGSTVVALQVDAQDNRFVTFTNGTIARLANDPAPVPPVILQGPESQTVFVGDNVTLSVSASGTPPLTYQWRHDGVDLPGATTTALNLSSVSTAQAGLYSVVISNRAGTVTSFPSAQLRVKSVQLYLGSQLLTNGTYIFQTPPTLSIRSAFVNGSEFYSLDGSAPSFSSVPCDGTFQLTADATVRAIGYSADFFQSEEADSVTVVVLVQHTLTATATGGGTVNLNPPGGRYSSTNVVTVSAAPLPGWTFLYWLGDLSGSSPEAALTLNSDKAVRAVFGTTLSTTTAGNGQVLLDPPGGLYAYGSAVRLTAVPQAGNYFGAWGNAVSGNTNPLYLTISSPTQTVSSIFGATPVGQAALTLEISGRGRIQVSPRANAYATGQTVTLTATPEAGQSFLGWSGDATGTQNPLAISMSQSRVVTAQFTTRATLRAHQPGIEGMTGAGFRFTVLSEPQLVWEILGSLDQTTWESLGTITNTSGQSQFTAPGAASRPYQFYRAKALP